MKKFFEYILPVAAGAVIAFYVLPNWGGNIEIFVQKIAMDWEIPIWAMRAILASGLALALCIVFGLVAKIALWLAIILVLLAVFAPALLKDVPIVSEDVKATVVQKIEEMTKQ